MCTLAGMQLYQNNEAFVLGAVGIKQETERDRYWGNRCWLNLGSVPCFLKLFNNPVRIAPPDSTVLKVLWAPFRTKNSCLLRVLLFPAILFIFQLTDMSLETAITSV